MDKIEFFGFISGIVCVYLNIKEKSFAWIFSCVSICCYFVVFYNASIYANAWLQLFFLLLSIKGYFNWTSKNLNGELLKISKSNRQSLLVSVFAICFLFGLLIGFLKQYTDSDVPELDAFTTALSIVAQVLLSKKKIENWVLWIIADLLYVGLYFYKGLYITTLLYLIFIVLAIMGYIIWRKKLVVEH